MADGNSLAAVILAAGHGKRMKSDLPKVLHEIGGIPLVVHVIRQAEGVGADPVLVVVGHGRERVIPVVEASGAEYVVQREQLGTGHAVGMTRDKLSGFNGDLLVLSGDVPLLRGETLGKVVEYHRQEGAVATVITAHAPDPGGYGRVLRDGEGAVRAIREHKDCTAEELRVTEINSGIYLFRAKPLFEALEDIDNDNAQGEYYLPDVFQLYFSRGEKVAAIAADFAEIHGINTREDLAEARRIFSSQGAVS